MIMINDGSIRPSTIAVKTFFPQCQKEKERDATGINKHIGPRASTAENIRLMNLVGDGVQNT